MRETCALVPIVEVADSVGDPRLVLRNAGRVEKFFNEVNGPSSLIRFSVHLYLLTHFLRVPQ